LSPSFRRTLSLYVRTAQKKHSLFQTVLRFIRSACDHFCHDIMASRTEVILIRCFAVIPASRTLGACGSGDHRFALSLCDESFGNDEPLRNVCQCSFEQRLFLCAAGDGDTCLLGGSDQLVIARILDGLVDRITDLEQLFEVFLQLFGVGVFLDLREVCVMDGRFFLGTEVCPDFLSCSRGTAPTS